MEKADCIIIGAGVVGLAVGRELALAGRDVIVLEAAGAIGTETSSRNSEVIHAGLYYPPGSLKARLCVEGKQRLYTYCLERGVEARQSASFSWRHAKRKCRSSPPSRRMPSGTA